MSALVFNYLNMFSVKIRIEPTLKFLYELTRKWLILIIVLSTIKLTSHQKIMYFNL